MSCQITNLYEGALAFAFDDYQDESEIGMGVDGSIANVPEDYNTENLKIWLATVCRVFGFEEVSVSRYYTGLRMVDFTLHGVGKPADLGWQVLEQWGVSKMWLNVCIGNRMKVGSCIKANSLRCGNWNGANNYFQVSCLSQRSCTLEVNYAEQTASFQFLAQHGDDSQYLLSFNFWHIFDFVIVDTSDLSATMVYLTVRHPPKLTHEETMISFIAFRTRLIEIPGVHEVLLGSCHVYQVAIASSTLSELLDTLAKMGKKAWFTKVVLSENSDKPCCAQLEWLDGCEIDQNNDTARYAWQCVMSTPGYWHGRFNERFWEELNMLQEVEATSFLYALADELQNDMFSTATNLLEKAKLSKWMQFFSEVHENLAWIKRVVVTPTRILYCSPDLLQVRVSELLRNLNENV